VQAGRGPAVKGAGERGRIHGAGERETVRVFRQVGRQEAGGAPGGC